MTEPENFLERWSRKKREAVQESKTADVPASDPAQASAVTPTPGDESSATPKPVRTTQPPPEFDPASLPSLESITGQTDIRGFMAPGVPSDLTRAALRRAWSADPAIRDFVGLQENDWDFNDPEAIPGFGPLPEGYDVKQMVAKIYGEVVEALGDPNAPGPPPAETPTQVTTTTQVSLSDRSAEADPHGASDNLRTALPEPEIPNTASQQNILQCNEDDHRQQVVEPIDDSAQRTRQRRHGSALPEV